MGNHLDRRHQPEGDPGRARVAEGRARRGREPRPGARRSVREASGRSSAPTARTRRCSPTRRSRRSTSRCRTRCTASGRSARSRPASTCSARSRSRGTPTRSRRRSTRPSATGRLLSEAFMYRHNPQTKRADASWSTSGAIGELRLIRSAFSYSLYDEDEHPAAHRRRRRRADGRRLLQRQRLAPARRRAGARLRRSVVRPVRHRLGVHRHAALPRRRARDVRLRHGAAEPRRARGDRQRRLALPRRPVALQRAGDRGAPRRTASSGSSSSARTPTGSSSRT